VTTATPNSNEAARNGKLPLPLLHHAAHGRPPCPTHRVAAEGLREMNSPPPASAAPLPNTATKLAYERTRIAYERTMMAWIRTASALITFGFAVYKFFEFELKNSPVSQMIIGPRGFGLGLIIIGLLSVILGMFEHARDLTALRREYEGMPRSYSGLVGIVLGVLGLCALVIVVLHA
jgi:putative membrane protein